MSRFAKWGTALVCIDKVNLQKVEIAYFVVDHSGSSDTFRLKRTTRDSPASLAKHTYIILWTSMSIYDIWRNNNIIRYTHILNIWMWYSTKLECFVITWKHCDCILNAMLQVHRREILDRAEEVGWKDWCFTCQWQLSGRVFKASQRVAAGGHSQTLCWTYEAFARHFLAGATKAPCGLTHRMCLLVFWGNWGKSLNKHRRRNVQ